MSSWVFKSCMVAIGEGSRMKHEPHFLLRGSDPIEFRRHIARTAVLGIEQRLDAHPAPDHPDLGAVMPGDVVQVVGGHHAGRARHLLQDEERMPGQVAAQMRNDEAAVEFITAAAGAADHELDLLAGEELLDRLGACRQRTERAERGGTTQRRDSRNPVLSVQPAPCASFPAFTHRNISLYTSSQCGMDASVCSGEKKMARKLLPSGRSAGSRGGMSGAAGM